MKNVTIGAEPKRIASGSRGHHVTWPRLLAFACLCFVSFATADALGTGTADRTFVPDWSEAGFVAYSDAELTSGYGAMGGYSPHVAEAIGSMLENGPIPAGMIWSFLGAEKVTYATGSADGFKELVVVRTKDPDTFVVRLIWLIKAIFPGTTKIRLPDKSIATQISTRFSDISAETDGNGVITITKASDDSPADPLRIYEGDGFVIMTDDSRIQSRSWIPAGTRISDDGSRTIVLNVSPKTEDAWLQASLLAGIPPFLSRHSTISSSTILNGLLYIGGK